MFFVFHDGGGSLIKLKRNRQPNQQANEKNLMVLIIPKPLSSLRQESDLKYLVSICT